SGGSDGLPPRKGGNGPRRKRIPCRSSSRNTDQLVSLEAEPPFRMRETIGRRRACVLLPVRTVHRLQKEIPEVELLETLRHRFRLRVDEFQLVARHLFQFRVGLRADADPVYPL